MWDNIINWFGSSTERKKLTKDFNKAAKNSFLSGEVATLLKAKITIGDIDYSHHLSKFLRSGLKIKALSGKDLNESDIYKIGETILNDKLLVRKLITLGWDTLVVENLEEGNGHQWNIEAYSEF